MKQFIGFNIFSSVLVLFLFAQLCFGYDKFCGYQDDGIANKYVPTITVFSNTLARNLTKYSCELFTRFSNIQITLIDEYNPKEYCDKVSDKMKSSTAKDVIILALDTEEVHKPCSYRVHSESPVLIQLTLANRAIIGIDGTYFFEFWVDTRFGELILGPLQFTRGGDNKTPSDTITLDVLIRTIRFGIHLGNQSPEVMLTGLYPPLKLMSDEKLYEEWAKYRDEQASKDDFNVSWIHSIGIVVITIYAALIVYSMEPDHRAFVHAEKMPEGQSCHSETSDTNVLAEPSRPIQMPCLKEKAYVPLSQFLANSK